MKQKRRGLHQISLTAMFIVGNFLIRYPWRGIGGRLLFVFGSSLLGGLLAALLIYPLFRRIWRSPLGEKKGRRFWLGALSVVLSGYALVGALVSCRDYVALSERLILPGGNRLFQAGLFLLCAVLLAGLNQRGMDSFALISFGVAVSSVLLLFVAGIPHFRMEYLPREQWTAFFGSWRELWELWRELLRPLTVLVLYFALTAPKGGEGALAAGTVLGCALLLLCVLQAFLTFGVSYAGELPYPYAYSTRIPSVGQYFFRLEGFSYLVNYAACLIRCGVSLAVIKRLAQRFFPRRAALIPPIAGAFLLAFFLFP